MNSCTGSRLVRGPLVRALGTALAPLGMALAACGCAPDPEPHAEAAQEDAADPEGEPTPDERSGRWKRIDIPLTPEQREEIARLQAIGYSAGSMPVPARSGVTAHVRDRAHPGTNLYTSGHAASAVLMDMDGRTLHAWRADFASVWPAEKLRRYQLSMTSFWRRAYLHDNGDLLAIFEGHSLVKLDKDSHVLWKSRCGAHHDLQVMPDGDIFVLTRTAQVVPAVDAKVPVLEDFVSVLGSDGEEKVRISLLEALDRSTFRGLWDEARARRGDVLHTNSLFVLDGNRAGDIPAFRAGNVLVSSRTLSFIAVLDPERREVVWTLRGSFKEQHDPQLLPSGNLLLFDNAGRGEASTVLELDPATAEKLWEYRGAPEAPFYSKFCGTAARLPNGNTLITESDNGRAFEVTSGGEIVWEFWNPERAGDDGEFIATLFEVVRLEPEYTSSWLR